MLAHTRELAFLQPKFTGPLRPTVAMCCTGATQNTPGFYFCLYLNGSEISLQSTSSHKNKQPVSHLGGRGGRGKEKKEKEFLPEIV